MNRLIVILLMFYLLLIVNCPSQENSLWYDYIGKTCLQIFL